MSTSVMLTKLVEAYCILSNIESNCEVYIEDQICNTIVEVLKTINLVICEDLGYPIGKPSDPAKAIKGISQNSDARFQIGQKYRLKFGPPHEWFEIMETHDGLVKCMRWDGTISVLVGNRLVPHPLKEEDWKI